MPSIRRTTPARKITVPQNSNSTKKDTSHTSKLNLAEKKYRISFYARHPKLRGVSPGHIWIGFEGYGTFGFQPRLQEKGPIEESPEGYDIRVCFEVNLQALNSAYDVIKRSRSKRYLIGGDTCIGLAINVARAAGFKVTKSKIITQSPAHYLEDLYEMNRELRVPCP